VEERCDARRSCLACIAPRDIDLPACLVWHPHPYGSLWTPTVSKGETSRAVAGFRRRTVVDDAFWVEAFAKPVSSAFRIEG
jgi:hypothetical protein